MVHDTTCAGTADKTILAPAIHIPGSHPGHQTKNHPARKGGSISRDEIKKKTPSGSRGFHGFSQMGSEENQPQSSLTGAEELRRERASIVVTVTRTNRNTVSPDAV